MKYAEDTSILICLSEFYATRLLDVSAF